MQDKKDWFTISEAAKYLGVSPDTLRRWEKAGRIAAPNRTAGGARRYSKKLLEQILKGGKEETTSETKKTTIVSAREIKKMPAMAGLIALIITLAILLPIIFLLLNR